MSCCVFSQDRIVRVSGDDIYCKVTGIDSTRVYYEMDVEGRVLPGSIERKVVLELQCGTIGTDVGSVLEDHEDNVTVKDSLKRLYNIAKVENVVYDSVFMTKNFWGYRFYSGTERMKRGELKAVMCTDLEAFAWWRSAKANYVVAYAAAFAGGWVLGYTFGDFLLGEDLHIPRLLGGIGLVVLSVNFESYFHQNMQKAIDEYNSSLNPASAINNIDLGVGLSFGQAKLKLRF